MFDNFIENNFNLFQLECLIRILLACFCGFIIGLERSKRQKEAGIRTHIILAMGCAIMTIVSKYGFTDVIKQGMNVEPSRLASNIITGIGFLGAGVIFVRGGSVRGLTTAAGLWACACMGLSIGIGFYTIAILGTVFALVAFLLLPRLEILLTRGSNRVELHIELYSRQDLKKLIDYIRSKGGKINLIDYNSSYANSGLSVYTINMISWTKNTGILIKDILELEYVNFVEEIL